MSFFGALEPPPSESGGDQSIDGSSIVQVEEEESGEAKFGIEAIAGERGEEHPSWFDTHDFLVRSNIKHHLSPRFFLNPPLPSLPHRCHASRRTYRSSSAQNVHGPEPEHQRHGDGNRGFSG